MRERGRRGGRRRKDRTEGGKEEGGGGREETHGTESAVEGPRRWENIDAAFTRRIFLGNRASVGRELVDATRWAEGWHTERDRRGNGRAREGGRAVAGERARYRQLAGSYIELRSGAYLSAGPSDLLSPRLSRQLSRSSTSLSRLPASPPLFPSATPRRPPRVFYIGRTTTFSERADNRHWCYVAPLVTFRLI